MFLREVRDSLYFLCFLDGLQLLENCYIYIFEIILCWLFKDLLFMRQSFWLRKEIYRIPIANDTYIYSMAFWLEMFCSRFNPIFL